MKLKWKIMNSGLLSLGLIIVMTVPISCFGNNTEGGFFSSRSVSNDQLIALGFAPTYVHKTKQGKKIEPYLLNFIDEDKITPISNDKPSEQNIDVEKINSYNLDGAFIANFQWKLYNNLKKAGLKKEQIGFTTMGETYFPDLDYKVEKMITPPAGQEKMSFADAKKEWNAKYPDNKIYPTSEDLSINKIIKLTDSQNPNKFINGINGGGSATTMGSNFDINNQGGGYLFDFSYDFSLSFEVLAKNLDRILGNKAIKNEKTALQRAELINVATKRRIANLRDATSAKLGTKKSVVALKPNYAATGVDDMIDSHFAWDPTIFPFLYSPTNGMNMTFPEYDSAKGNIGYLQDDVDGLIANNQNAIMNMFKGNSDYVVYLKPDDSPLKDDAIKNKLKTLTTTGSTENVIIVLESLWYQGNFGVLGTNLLIDDFANKMKIDTFEDKGQDKWGFTPFTKLAVEIYNSTGQK